MNTLALVFATVSITFNLPQGLLSSICYVESGHNVSAVNQNDKGSRSRGVCQLKRGTAKALGFTGKPWDLQNPEINIYYAGKLLAYQIKRCGSINKAILAYNSGKCNKGSPSYLKKVTLAKNQGK